MTKRIAIIGAGVTGLTAAYSLYKNHDVTVFEKDTRVGGHSRTIDVCIDNKPVAIDTGFIVLNDRNYPLFRKLLAHLNVPYEKSDMSFGVSIKSSDVEYSSSNIIAQPRNLLRREFWRMLFDILRFNRTARRWQNRFDMSLGDMLKEFNGGDWFNNYYIKPMGAAIWSCSTTLIEEFPAGSFVRFFDTHGLLTIFKQPQWFTITGGSRNYVRAITDALGSRIQTSCTIKRITQGPIVEIEMQDGQIHQFDTVIMATHPDQSLAMISNPSERQKDILGAFTFQDNHIVVHQDLNFMPRRKKAWASWIYLGDNAHSISLSYWINLLQNKDKNIPPIQTLNPLSMPNKDLILDEHWFAHPVFTRQAIEAQNLLHSIQGQGNIYFCGAWTRNGFHEDGVASAVDIVQNRLGEPITWL